MKNIIKNLDLRINSTRINTVNFNTQQHLQYSASVGRDMVLGGGRNIIDTAQDHQFKDGQVKYDNSFNTSQIGVVRSKPKGQPQKILSNEF